MGVRHADKPLLTLFLRMLWMKILRIFSKSIHVSFILFKQKIN